MPNIRWTPELVTQEIRRQYQAGLSLAYSHVLARDRKLLGAAVRHFSGWRQAIEAAGIRYDKILRSSARRRSAKISKWSKEAIIKEIRRLNAAGEDLSYAAVKNKHLALLTAASLPRYFGSWRAAVEAAGISYLNIKKKGRTQLVQKRAWYRDLVLEQIGYLRKTGFDLSEANARRNFPALLSCAEEVFGSWAKAVAAIRKQP